MFVVALILPIIQLKETSTKKKFSVYDKVSLTRINVNIFYLFVDLPVLLSMMCNNICHYVYVQNDTAAGNNL